MGDQQLLQRSHTTGDGRPPMQASGRGQELRAAAASIVRATQGAKVSERAREGTTPAPRLLTESPLEDAPGAAAGAGKRKLLDEVRDAIRTRHYSYRTEEAYVGWIKRFILFHGKRHPAEMGKPEIEQFLTALAVKHNVAASTQNQALAALLFLYKDVLEVDPGWLDDVVRAKRPQRLPTVLTRKETEALLGALRGVSWLMAMLLYGAGLRLRECLRLRVKDIDFSRHEIVVREGKGNKDRVTMLPAVVKDPLLAHLGRVPRLHERDLAAGLGRVALPDALARKYPNADQEWGWQWVFPASRICTEPRFGAPQRYHLHDSVPQRAIHEAARTVGIAKPVGPHTMRSAST